jgi:hypothetical protein
MVELLRLATFLVFVALGLRARFAAAPHRRRAVQHLVAYVVLLSAAAGISQRDAWPFTSHTIAVGRARADSQVCRTRFVGVDARGAAWPLDPYSFTPVYDSILQYWVEQAPARLDEAQRGRALGFLLQRAEESRQRLAAGERIGPERRLGPLGSPYWLMLPRHLEASPGPYVRLRALSACWTIDPGPGAEPAREWGVLAEWPPAASLGGD